MIRQPSDVQTKAKKIRMLIAGYPGIGKTTLGLSAPRALHIDIDAGIDRIEPRYPFCPRDLRGGPELLSESENLVKVSFGFQLIEELDERVLGLENLGLRHEVVLPVYFNPLCFEHVILLIALAVIMRIRCRPSVRCSQFTNGIRLPSTIS